MKGQDKHDLWESNVKKGKNIHVWGLPGTDF